MINAKPLPEDELDFYSKLVETAGWKLFVEHWRPVVDETARQLRAEDCQNRDWIAGAVAAYEKIFRYPEARIKQLMVDLGKRK